jgi:TolB protein
MKIKLGSLTFGVGVALALTLATLPALGTAPGANGKIVFRHFHSLFVVNADGSGEVKLTHPLEPYEDHFPDWSPTGAKVGFERCASRCAVWTVNANGGGLKRLGPSCNAAPPACEDWFGAAWGPNGKTLAFTRAWGPLQKGVIKSIEIDAVNANGTGMHQITHLTTQNPFSVDDASAMWSPDGKQLVFGVKESATGTPAGGRALFVVNADGSGQRQLTPWSLNAGDRPDWSPDGTLIVFRSIAKAKGQHGNIYTIHPDGTGLRQLTHYGGIKPVESPTFSPDGKSITFSRFSGTSAYSAIFAMGLDGSGLRRITKSDTNYEPDWGPAG